MAFGIDDAISAGLQIVSEYKTCRICGEIKPLSFYHQRKDSGRFRTECSKCKSTLHRKWYEKNEIKAKENSKKLRINDQRRALLNSCKSSARNKNLAFNLTLEDIVIPEVCPFLEIKLTNIQGSGFIGSNASVDRIDPTKGYVNGNIQIISRKANHMKLNASSEELLTFASNIIKMMGN